MWNLKNLNRKFKKKYIYILKKTRCSQDALQLPMSLGRSVIYPFPPNLQNILREGFQKKTAKRLTPPPLSTSTKVNNIHAKEFFSATFADPPPLNPYPRLSILKIFF